MTDFPRARTHAWLFSLMMFVSSRAGAEFTTLNANVRALGMGEAFTAVSRDQSSLFYNPAGLAAAESLTWNLATVRAGASGLDAIKKIGSLTKGGSNANFTNAVGELYGHGAWTGFGIESAAAAPGFGLASYDHADARVRVDDPANPRVYTGVINDFGYVGGGAITVADRLALGAAVRFVKRTGARLTLGAATLADLDADQIQSKVTGWGRGFGLDLGARWRLPTSADFDLTAAATWRNVGQTRFTSTDPNTSVPFDDNDVTLGLAVAQDYFWGKSTFAVDYRGAESEETQLLRRFNFGLELKFPLVDIRGGFREGYYAYGAGVDLGLCTVSAASYGVELGAYPGQIEDRRYMAEINVRFDVGATFSRFEPGRRGRLKQRR